MTMLEALKAIEDIRAGLKPAAHHVLVSLEGDLIYMSGQTGFHSLDMKSTSYARLYRHVAGFISSQPYTSQGAI